MCAGRAAEGLGPQGLAAQNEVGWADLASRESRSASSSACTLATPALTALWNALARRSASALSCTLRPCAAARSLRSTSAAAAAACASASTSLRTGTPAEAKGAACLTALTQGCATQPLMHRDA